MAYVPLRMSNFCNLFEQKILTALRSGTASFGSSRQVTLHSNDPTETGDQNDITSNVLGAPLDVSGVQFSVPVYNSALQQWEVNNSSPFNFTPNNNDTLQFLVWRDEFGPLIRIPVGSVSLTAGQPVNLGIRFGVSNVGENLATEILNAIWDHTKTVLTVQTSYFVAFFNSLTPDNNGHEITSDIGFARTQIPHTGFDAPVDGVMTFPGSVLLDGTSNATTTIPIVAIYSAPTGGDLITFVPMPISLMVGQRVALQNFMVTVS